MVSAVVGGQRWLPFGGCRISLGCGIFTREDADEVVVICCKDPRQQPDPLYKPEHCKTFEDETDVWQRTEVSIAVDRTEGARLGIDVDHSDGKSLLIEHVSSGLVSAWNKEHPDMAVQEGDRLVAANGVRGDAIELVEECRKNAVLRLTVRRAHSNIRALDSSCLPPAVVAAEAGSATNRSSCKASPTSFSLDGPVDVATQSSSSKGAHAPARHDHPCNTGFKKAGIVTASTIADGYHRVTYGDGSTYAGQMLSGRRHGQGLWHFWTGQYDGEWEADLQHGSGRQTWSDGRTYQGQFHYGKFSGHGRMVWHTAKGVEVYEGNYQDDLKHGTGKFVWADGRSYDGEWQRGKRHGRGMYLSIRREERVGFWNEGRFERWETLESNDPELPEYCEYYNTV